MIIFYGYSDDVVISGYSKASIDEHYSEYFLLSDGTNVHANHGREGWEFTSSHPESILIPAADPDDEGIDHTDERIPDWCEPSGYSQVLIIPIEATIIAQGDEPFPADAKNDIPIFKLITAMNKVMDWDADDGMGVDDLKTALNNANLKIEPKEGGDA